MTNMGRLQIDRRSLMHMGFGLAGGVLVPAAFARSAEAETIGTYPAGVGTDSVFVGITIPLTGSYSQDGKDELRGYQLAIEQINAGDSTAKQWGLPGPGILGKKIRYGYADSETQPNPAVQAQTRFITHNKAIMITGSVSSATAVALEKLAQREKVLNMVGASGSNATTGKDCQRYGFRSQDSAYMAAKALSPVLVKELGAHVKAAYLVPDYTYGTSLFASMDGATRKLGWQTVSKQLVPLGTTDFGSALINIANSGADVFVNIAFGNDSIASNKQAKQFGVLPKMKLVVPNISPFQYQESGDDIMVGVYGTVDFLWQLENRFPLAKTFVETFNTKFNYKPEWTAHIAYMQTYIWALAVTGAGSFDPVKVIKELESGRKWDSTLGEVYYAAYNHQLVRPVPVVQGNTHAAMTSKDDFYRLVELVPGEGVMPPPGMFGCKLGPYT